MNAPATVAAETLSGSSVDRATRRILDAAGAHLVRNPRASLAEVAEAIGCGRTTLHRRFPTREHLVSALAVDAVTRLEAAFEAARPDDGPAPDALGRALAAFIPLAEEFHLLSDNQVWDVPALRDGWDRLDARMGAVIDRGKRDGDIRPELPTALVVDAIAGMVWTVGDGVITGRVARRSAPVDLLDLLLHGVLRRPVVP